MHAPAEPVDAVFFDGETARRQFVRIGPARNGLGLAILREDAVTLVWPYDRLRALADQSDNGRLTLTLMAETTDEAPRDPARLVVTDAATVAWLLRTRPSLMRRDTRPGTLRKVVLWLSAAAASVWLMLFVILPGLSDYLADNLPVETEVAFGKSVMAQIEWLLGDATGRKMTCSNPAGLAALERLTDRLMGDRDIGYTLSFRVLDHEMVNAFAAPGGQVVILRGLLAKASGPDEVAAILAHEIGHVAARDPTRLALRAVGSAGILSVVLGDVTGGSLIALAGDHLLRSSYTRDAEAAADTFAHGLLDDARIATDGMAAFFDRIAGLTDSTPEYLSSHPLSRARAETARAYRTTQGETSPALGPQDWKTLQDICKH